MKQCPRCSQTYSDDSLNFCLNDGELLTVFGQQQPAGRFEDEPPPTMILDQARVTNPVGWPQSAQPPAQWQPQMMQPQPFGSFVAARDKTLPTVALILGLLSVVLICCYGGIWLGLPAAIVGFLGMRNADSNPDIYEGRGLAVAGMVLGIISFVASFIFAIIAMVAN